MTQPNESTYSLTLLNQFPRFGSQGQAVAAGITVPTFNPAARSKRWTRPIQPGEDPADGITLGDWILSADKQSIVFHPAGIAISIGDAAAVNIPPDVPPQANDPIYSQPGYALPEFPVPARAALGNEKVTLTPFGAIVSRTDITATSSTGDATLASISADTQAIRKALNV